VEATLKAAEEAWAEGAAAVADKLALLCELMRKFSGPDDPAEELLALLACGHLSNAMHQFLSANLGAASSQCGSEDGQIRPQKYCDP